MSPIDCVRAAIPGATDDLCDNIIWGRTPFPFKRLTARDFYKAGSRWRRAQTNNRQLCEWCDNLAVDRDLCRRCGNALHPAPQAEPETRE